MARRPAHSGGRSVQVRLAAYAIVLAAAFGVGLGIGELVPGRTDPASPHPAVDTVHEQHGRQSP